MYSNVRLVSVKQLVAIIHTSTLIEGNKFVWKIKPAVFFLRLQFDNESKSE